MADQDIEKWAQITIQKWLKVIKAKRIKGEGELAASFAHFVTASAAGDISKIVFTYKISGTFVDMGVGRGTRLEDVKTNRELLKKAGIQGRQAKQWQGKILFSEINLLSKIVTTKYGDQASKIIIQSFPQKINLNG